ncbi:unnamed protein product [Calypogeia fissa]
MDSYSAEKHESSSLIGPSPLDTSGTETVLELAQDLTEALLPGIPDNITLNLMPKLPWRSFHILSSVSPRWLEAIRSRRVYDARVRSCSTETLIVVNRAFKQRIPMCYSVNDKRC